MNSNVKFQFRLQIVHPLESNLFVSLNY